MSHGFIPRLLTLEELGHLIQLCQGEGLVDSELTYFSNLLDLFEYHLICPASVIDVACRLLGTDRVSMQSIELHNQPPQSLPIPHHQDNFYHCLSSGLGVKILLPLCALDRGSGALTFLDCNYNYQTLKHTASSVPNFSSYLQAEQYIHHSFSETTYQYEPGDASFHYLSSIHYSDGNNSNSTTSFLVYRFYSENFEINADMVKQYESIRIEHHKLLAN
jgi:ectoine hydroxylase-related dioxygenase (phytanoyl-CoA dioxygenase family)